MSKSRWIATDFIANSTKPSGYDAGEIVEFIGWSASGDGGDAQWKATGNVIAVSQTPAMIGTAKCSDASGNEFEIIPTVGGVEPSIKIEQVGGDPSDSDNSSAFQAAASSGYGVQVTDKNWKASGIDANNSGLWHSSVATISAPVGSVNAYQFRVTSSVLRLNGINFDAGNMAAACNCVLVAGDEAGINAELCNFNNAVSSGGLGEGLNIFISKVDSRLIDCGALGNGSHGISVQETPRMTIRGGVSQSNGANGWNFNNYDLSLSKTITNLTVSNIYGINNGASGIIFGNPFNDNVFTGDNFGFDNNVCVNVVASGLFATGNSTYGVVLSMVSGDVTMPYCRNNSYGGLLVNGRFIEINGPIVTNNPAFGIDIGAGSDITITGGRVAFNSASGGGTGFLLEACQNVRVTGTDVIGNGIDGATNMLINAYGGTGDGRYFPSKASSITLACNITTTGTRVGLTMADNPDNIIDKNCYFGGSPENYTRYRTNTVNLNCNSAAPQNETFGPISSGGIVVIPDVSKNIDMNTTETISDFRPYSYNEYLDKVAYCTITASGAGYDAATTIATISGDGSGAEAIAIVNGGVVVGIRVTNPGSGYTSASISITGGGGSGATATATVGTGLPGGMEKTITHNAAQTVTRVANPIINSPSAADLNAPNRGATTLKERFGQWIVKSATYTV